MANGKNKIIWYRDWREVIKDLTIEQKGVFLEWFSAYVNDENPEMPKEDLELYGTIFFVKTMLKRDLRAWLSVSDKNAENGKKGGRPRKSDQNPKNPKNPTAFNKASEAKKGDKDKDKEKEKRDTDVSPKNPHPTIEEFVSYGLDKKPTVSPEALKLKYEAWKESGWVNGNGSKIKNWKTSLLNTLTHLPEVKSKKETYDPVKYLNQ